MKSNWLLIVEKDALSLSSCFYKIAIGTSLQDQRDWKCINCYATKHGYYFQKWSSQVVDFLHKIAESLNCEILDLNMHSCKARELVRSICLYGEPPKKHTLTPAKVHFRRFLKPAAYFISQINVIRHAEAEQRKKPKAKGKSPKG